MGYKGIDKDTFMKENEQSQSRRSFERDEFWSPTAAKAGMPPHVNKIRIMPPHENMPAGGFVETKQHFLPERVGGKVVINAKTGRPAVITVACATMFGKVCPACVHVNALQEQAKLEKEPDVVEQLKNQAYDQRAKLRFFIQIVDLAHPEKGVMPYAFGPDVEKRLRSCFLDDDQDFQDITHPTQGRDVLMHVVKKAGTDFNEYPTVRPASKPSKLLDADWLKLIKDLTVYATETSIADIEKAVRGERPAGSGAAKTAAPSAAKKAPEPAEEEAAPPKPKAKAPKPVVEDEGEEAEPAAKPKAKGKQPMAEEAELEEEVEDENPYATALALAAKKKFEPYALTPDEYAEIAAKKKQPTCFGVDDNGVVENDPDHPACQGCRVFLACYTEVQAKQAA